MSFALLAALAAPTWTLTRTSVVGFSSQGQLITREEANGRFLPELTLRDPDTAEVTGRVVFPEAGGDVGYLLAVTPDLKAAAWVGADGDTLTVRSPSGRWSSSIPGVRGSRELLFSPDGRTLAVANDNGYVQLWNVADGVRRATLLMRSRPDQLAFRPDSQVLAVNERVWSRDGSVSVWSLDTGERRGTVPGTQGLSRSIFAYAPDGQTLLMETPRFTVGWIDPESGEAVRQVPTFVTPCPKGSPFPKCAHAPFAASLSADGSRLALNVVPGSYEAGARVLVYDTRTTRLVRAEHLGRASAALTPRGEALLVSGPGATLSRRP